MVTYKAHTDVGQRECNEDSMGIYEKDDMACFMVADGLGGHGGGEYASAIAKETIREQFEHVTEDNMSDFLDRCFVETQENVMMQQKTDSKMVDMKTTLVTLLIHDGTAAWGHIGDSRLYHFKGNKLITHTLDHSVPQMLVNIGEIKEKEIRGHEDRNRLLRVIGSPWGKHSYDLAEPVELGKFDAFLLCSDGFWELIDEKKMVAFLKKSSTVDEWMDQMAAYVKEMGSSKDMDNNTAIAVWVEEER